VTRPGGADPPPLDLPFFAWHPAARLPAYAHPGDAGLDLCSVEDVVVAPGARRLVGTGLRLAVPSGCVGLVMPRSGLALRHGVTVLNAPGVVDAPYRGELGVVLVNTDPHEPFEIRVGDRIAQLVVVALPAVQPRLADDGPGETARGAGGFGSTGP
jgi:dUTP pyrophosphatase